MVDKHLLIVGDLPELGEVVGRVVWNIGYDVRVTTHAEEFKRDVDSFDRYRSTNPHYLATKSPVTLKSQRNARVSVHRFC